MITKFTQDEYKLVMYSLRHHCSKVRTAKRAIEIIANKIGMEEEKVEAILIEMFKE
jgi:hypothetical protein